jgi:hypothetical protein
MQKGTSMPKNERANVPVEFKNHGGCLVIKIHLENFTEMDLQSILPQVKEKADESSILVFDFLETKSISIEALQFLNIIIGSTQQRKARTAFLMNDLLKKKVTEAGLSSTFPIFSDMKEALRERTFEVHPEAIHFLNAIREAVFQTLWTFTKTKATAGAMFKKGEGELPAVDIAGVIGIFAKNYQATIILGFEKRAYLAIMGRMHSKEYTGLNTEIHDGAAELVSQIIDNAKLTFGGKSREIEKSIASIAVGSTFQIYLEKNPTVIIPITTEFGSMALEMAARPNS